MDRYCFTLCYNIATTFVAFFVAKLLNGPSVIHCVIHSHKSPKSVKKNRNAKSCENQSPVTLFKCNCFLTKTERYEIVFITLTIHYRPCLTILSFFIDLVKK
jgi:hypothetical protein